MPPQDHSQEQEEINPYQEQAEAKPIHLQDQDPVSTDDNDHHDEKEILQWATQVPLPDSSSEISLTDSEDHTDHDSTIISLDDSDDLTDKSPISPVDGARVQETKDVFSDSQKVAYVGLCAVTSTEVVHDFQDPDLTYARMSAGNWQRNLMKQLYIHMDISQAEIQMIESLTRHDIRPTDLVHQFVSQGDTTTIDVNDLCTPQDKGTQDHLASLADTNDLIKIDLRWTVLCDLILLCLSLENYDARSRVFIKRIASYLSVDSHRVMEYEKYVTDYLLLQDKVQEKDLVQTQNKAWVELQNSSERQSHSKRRKKKRIVMIGLAAMGGGVILGLSAGLMAPVIAGGLGTVLATAGVTGTSAFLGGTTGIGLITGAATMFGVQMGAKSMNRRTKSINTFEFLPIEAHDSATCIISINGWLIKGSKQEDTVRPFSVLDPLLGDHYTLFWEPEVLEKLGSAFRILASEAVTFSIQQALGHTIMGALMAGLTWPLALTKIGYLVDNPWANALDRARLAGLILADVLMNRNLGARPVTLVGYSLGALVIFNALVELARVNAYGLVEDVYLFGTPTTASPVQWKACASVVSGRFVNGYAANDWLLGFLFRASVAGLGSVAGLRPIKNVDNTHIDNIDCTDVVKGHLSYRTLMPLLLKRAGLAVTTEELSSVVAEMEVSEKAQTPPRRESLSSLVSGSASIVRPTDANNGNSFSTNDSDAGHGNLSRTSGTFVPIHSSASLRDVSSKPERKGLFQRIRRSFSQSERSVTQQELADAGVTVKEIKSTLGCMVVPDEVVRPMPRIALEMPKHARIHR